MAAQKVPRLSETINFSEEEEKVLAFWKQIKAFETCLEQSKGKPRFSFYDGPPFATGLPHYGHILAGTIKDVVTRYAHQQGFHVERRFGWDTHGLPVEFEIDKLHNIKGPDDVMKMGIAKYNGECRKIVMRYAEEWQSTVSRIGRWIDFNNDYKTLYPWFMESVWWVFKQLFDKGLVYQGNKVMPYSTACSTPLSNFESGQNYKDVIDPTVTVSLPLLDFGEDAALLVWTTTPWTLPSNLAACVHPNLIYVLLEQKSTKKRYIMMEARISFIFQADDYILLKKFPGQQLKGLHYKPIFNYFEHLKDSAFKVLVDEYVTADSGTGVVHQAPYFGEDDNRVCLAHGVITKDQEPICPVDASGRFLPVVTDFAGQYVKDADKHIIKCLRDNDRLVYLSQIKHSYPYCWRSETPLIYRAIPSWFIRVEHMTQNLLKSSRQTYWVPDFVKHKRFGNWLRDARDWAVSRNRYWGTPIPIWMSANGDEIVCIGSIKELEELTGKKITDLHRESIDHLEIPSKTPGKPPLKRISEVFDCWFESGSMPFAQNHYPFENKQQFEESFPADFIAEGIDQTRGWFYTLIVISTALFGRAPFKNLIANGLVLASDGQKMSKSKKNFPDPMVVIKKYGADALRLYLISSPVVRAENLRFKEEGVRDVLKDVFLPWYNAFRFLMQNIEIYVQTNNVSFYYDSQDVTSYNIMDKWILSFTQSLLQYIRSEMALYHLYNVVPRLTKFIDYLTNWYVRMNRKRIKGEGGQDDCKAALMTLFDVLFNIVKMMAPFSPFLSETMYKYLQQFTKDDAASVHYLMLPEPNNNLIDKDIERAVSRMQSVIELGRMLRERKNVPIKYPLSEVIIIHQDEQYLNDILPLKDYIHLELNVKTINTTSNKSLYGITLRAEPDFKKLGARLQKDLKSVVQEIQALSDSEITDMIDSGFKMIGGHLITIDDVRLIFKAETLNTTDFEVNSDNDVLILMNMALDDTMLDEGVARELVNRVQKLRKKAHLVPTDEVTVFYETQGDLLRIANQYNEFIEGAIKANFQQLSEMRRNSVVIIDEMQTWKNNNLRLVLTKKSNTAVPTVSWANVELVGLQSRFANGSKKGLVLLEAANELLGVDRLKEQVSIIFGLDKFSLILRNGKPIEESNDLRFLSGRTIYAVPVDGIDINELPAANPEPNCKVCNFQRGGSPATLILENPQGFEVLDQDDYEKIIEMWVGFTL